MREDKSGKSPHEQWAIFRFGVIGSLLSSPPESGLLQDRLRELSDRVWQHPNKNKKLKISLSTIERWYYQSLKNNKDPVSSLRRKLRSDNGKQRHLNLEAKNWLIANYKGHSSWSGQLHYDNLNAWLKSRNMGESPPSYSTIIRFLRIKGFARKTRVRSPNAPGKAAALSRLEERETRSYELEYVGALWHLDFHHGSRKILTESGELLTPMALCVIDDRSRFVCHIQWYFNETTECLVHGFIQAILKRGLPRSTMLDNGSAMTSGEFTQGCLRLGIILEPTLPYSPHQNGKQESFWGNLEGRLMAMIEGKKSLLLDELNLLTQVWIEKEYNKRIHSETGQTPLDRFLNDKSVLRSSPDSNTLKLAFRREEKRTQRKSDGTISIKGQKFEIPSAYRTLKRLTVHFAEWDLRLIHLIDPNTQECLVAIYPQDKSKNSQGLRKNMSSIDGDHDEAINTNSDNSSSDEYPPLLQQLMSEYVASGLPPAYISGPKAVASSNNQKSKKIRKRDEY